MYPEHISISLTAAHIASTPNGSWRPFEAALEAACVEEFAAYMEDPEAPVLARAFIDTDASTGVGLMIVEVQLDRGLGVYYVDSDLFRIPSGEFGAHYAQHPERIPQMYFGVKKIDGPRR